MKTCLAAAIFELALAGPANVAITVGLAGGVDGTLNGNPRGALTGSDLVMAGLATGSGSQTDPLDNRWFLTSDDTPFTSFTASLSSNAFGVGMAVPEPATWAMMILGFGLVGYAARRRERLAFAAA